MTRDELFIKVAKLLFIIGTGVLLIIKIPEFISERNMNREFKARMQYYQVHGMSKITRGGYATHQRNDTVSKDTTMKNE